MAVFWAEMGVVYKILYHHKKDGSASIFGMMKEEEFEI
jgi:hypothetical protein